MTWFKMKQASSLAKCSIFVVHEGHQSEAGSASTNSTVFFESPKVDTSTMVSRNGLPVTNARGKLGGFAGSLLPIAYVAKKSPFPLLLIKGSGLRSQVDGHLASHNCLHAHFVR